MVFNEQARRNIIRARLDLEKAKKILINLDSMPESSVKLYIENLLSAMNLMSQVLLQLQTGSNKPEGFEDLNREVLNKMKLESKLYDLYFYLKNMTYRQIKKTTEGIEVGTWKASKKISKVELKEFYESVKAFVENVIKLVN